MSLAHGSRGLITAPLAGELWLLGGLLALGLAAGEEIRKFVARR